jgi:hypothetical protein
MNISPPVQVKKKKNKNKKWETPARDELKKG